MNSKSEQTAMIIDLEWNMFSSVNEGGAKASCQEDRETFDGMRRAQYEAWSDKAVQEFLNDISAAAGKNRNLASEKYIHMMKSTFPALYERLIADIPPVSQAAAELAQAISDKMVEQTERLFKEYPYISGSGRPLRSNQDCGEETSIETYQLGELYTYSVETLTALKAHILELEENGEALAKIILENTVKFYGYASLEKAESDTKERFGELEISTGCTACEE